MDYRVSQDDLDHPRCICGAPMMLATVLPLLKDDKTAVHTFECRACGHLLKVMHDEKQAA